MKRLYILTAVLSLALSCGDNGTSPEPTPEPEKPVETREIIKGGDITFLSYVEDGGGKFYDANAAERDALDILKESGMNLVRLRLYNDPGNPSFSPSDKMPKGYQDEEDMLSLARRAAAKGFGILLTFHYSDYWTNGTDQIKPHQWKDLDFNGLRKAVYDYTLDILHKMSGQGTPPEYVSLGNEIQAGMLYPDGAVKNMDKFCALLGEAARAVRTAAPKARIVIHSDGAGDGEKYQWLFGELRSHAVDYDIIGASYYPFWTGLKANEIRLWAEKTAASFDKDILIVETGYAWNKTLPDGWPGQLKDNGPYDDMTPNGQKNFIIDLKNQILSSSRILGFIYWDPVFIETPGLGWIVGEKNVVSNTTLFDFNGHALEALEAFN